MSAFSIIPGTLETSSGPVGFSTFYLFATAMAVGITAVLQVVALRQIGRRFFILLSLVAVVFYALALAAGEMGLGYFHLAAAGVLIVYNVSLTPGGGSVSRALLILALACGTVGLVRDGMGYSVEFPVAGPQAPWLVVSFLTSALLLGSALVAMVLGHWYLVVRELGFEVLRNVSVVLIVGLLLRLLSVGVTAVAQAGHWERLWWDAGGAVGFFSSIGLFVTARALFGLALPLVLSWMVWECVRIRANQSATGILYVVLAFVLIGEVIAKHLLISNRLII